MISILKMRQVLLQCIMLPCMGKMKWLNYCIICLNFNLWKWIYISTAAMHSCMYWIMKNMICVYYLQIYYIHWFNVKIQNDHSDISYLANVSCVIINTVYLFNLNSSSVLRICNTVTVNIYYIAECEKFQYLGIRLQNLVTILIR